MSILSAMEDNKGASCVVGSLSISGKLQQCLCCCAMKHSTSYALLCHIQMHRCTFAVFQVDSHVLLRMWDLRLILQPSKATAAKWQTKTAKPMPAGARIGRWAVLCARAWSVAVKTTKTRRKVSRDSINQPALCGSPVSSLLQPPFAAEKPALSVCNARQFYCQCH